jgi:hypothetical protein
MRAYLSALFVGLISLTSITANAAAPTKDWTMLVFLNGDNNLDSFGTANLKQMETIGSTDHINIVVQWASESAGTAKRILVQKSTDPNNVTSPVIQDLGKTDMGDYRNLISFIEWGAQNYPAQHYLVDVWDHGAGWHDIQAMGLAPTFGHRPKMNPMDISWDDDSGHSITTNQLAQALSEASQSIGQKIDIYASDACLMAMAEVADEMKDSVIYYGGSQETEPGAGWPYDQFLKRWNDNNLSDPRDVVTALAEEYTKSYQNGSNGSQEVTYAAYDMSKIAKLTTAVANLSASIQKLGTADLTKIATAASNSLTFTETDYADLVDFVNNVNSAQVGGLSRLAVSDIQEAMSEFVITSQNTTNYARAHGVSIWIPNAMSGYTSYSDRYSTLKFEADTKWAEALTKFLPYLPANNS